MTVVHGLDGAQPGMLTTFIEFYQEEIVSARTDNPLPQTSDETPLLSSLVSTEQVGAIFSSIYERDEWGSSGPGSNPTINIGYRGFLEKLLSLNDVRNVTDIGCGDWQYSRYINFGHADYRGYDVVPPLVERNQLMFGRPGVNFYLMPRLSEQIPGGDLLLMKDVLQHLSNEMVIYFRDKVLPRFRWVLVTNSWKKGPYNATNADIPVGSFRCLDVSKDPFCFKGAYVYETWAEWERIRSFLISN